MKAILFGLLLAGAGAHADSGFSGQYILHTTDCLVGGAPVQNVNPLTVKIVANDESFTMTFPFDFQGQAAEMPYADYAVGVHSGIMLGGSTYRQAALYSEDGKALTYTESDNEAPGMPLHELRSTIYKLEGNQLTITQTGDGVPARTCVATRM